MGAPGASLVVIPPPPRRGAYWGTKNTAKATLDVPDVGRVQFEADQGPKNPWSLAVGVSSAVHKRFDLFAEYGFSPGDLIYFAGGLTVRF